MNAVIIDDDYLNLELLESFLTKYCPTVNVVGRADTVLEALELIANLKPDLLFLDMELHNLTAKDLLRTLDLDKVQVIIISAFEKYALEMHKFQLTDYLLKPLLITDLISAVNKAEGKMEKLKKQEILLSQSSVEKYIALPEKDHLNITNLEEIIRLEASGNYTKIITRNYKNIVSAKTLKEYEDLLPKQRFLRVHHSHIVNIVYVSKYIKSKNGSLVLVDGSEIPISAKRKKEVTERILF